MDSNILIIFALICACIGGDNALSQVSIEPPPVESFCSENGIPALKGEKGCPGPPGLNGSSGTKGEKGVPGLKGDKGVDGVKGDTGPPSPPAQNGKDGAHGKKGEKGDEGKCDTQCGDIKKLEKELQALKTNYTGELAKIKQHLVFLDRNIRHALGSVENPAVSCKEILRKDRSAPNGPYYIKVTGVPGGKMLSYCIMKEYNYYCPNGLTQVMKIDGSKGTFKFSSPYWTNKKMYNPNGGITGCDYRETKLATYWSTPFTKICIRMRFRGRWRIYSRSLNVQANSLYDLIADGNYRRTALGRRQWKSFLPRSSLQSACFKEGFNVQGTAKASTKVRIGCVADQASSCKSPDSYIGFGTEGYSCNINPNTSCGNEAGCNADNGDQHFQTYGYIYVY